jgi:hypothetical protein
MGASNHYFTMAAPLLNIDRMAPKLTICTATGELKSSSGAVVLLLPHIPTLQARTRHIIPGFTNSLTMYMDKHVLKIHDKHGHKIMCGDREQPGAHLW